MVHGTWFLINSAFKRGEVLLTTIFGYPNLPAMNYEPSTNELSSRNTKTASPA
ncbi:MAG: hypothetical protein JWQ54_1876 [Mucilaginibacter sp.]|nr:hypothetical protein [Mucilaginibacter sp.]